ncbi:MAG: diguanylate cyclase, partial [Lachnospiraceae bacterium]|nr:diguanylate cyclase [Lachnospiraceae bacterium]
SPMEIYRKYLNIGSVDSLKLKSIQFPMLVEVDGVECIRQPFRDENDECISVLIGVENGMKLRLSYGDKQTIIDASKKAVPEMAEFAPDVIHIYSCASRRRYLGDEMSSMETSFFEDIATTVGFFTRGEILRVGDYLHFFNSTMVYVMAREGEKVSDEYFIDENALTSDSTEGMIPNLINYIGVVTNELEGQFLRTMSGMANIYKTMFIIDTEAKELIQLDSDDRVKKLLSEKEDYKDKFNNFIENVVNEEYVDLAKLFVNIDNLSAKMKLKNTISCDLLGKNVGWFRAQFVVINRDKDGNADRFVFTTQVIDDEKKELEEQHRIVEKLADTYHTIHLFDLETDGCKEIDTVELLHVLYKKHVANGGQCILHEAMKASVRPEHLDMMLEFTDFSTLDERLNGRKVMAIDFHGAINGWAKAQFIEYERNRNGNLSKVLFVTQIIEEEKRKEEELIKKSTIDELTGLLNRRAYEEAIRDLKSDSDLSYVICSLDVNGLKVVNDDIGHSAGDELLRGAAEVLSRCLGAYGKVFRIGGDEFNAIIVASDERIKLLADDLDNSMLAWTGKEVDSLSISYGFASRNEFPDKTVDELEEIADQRMYESKEAYYRHGGQDRRSQKQVYDMICKSYIKILSVNLSEDNYRIIKTNESEMKKDKGYSDESISKWLTLFAQSGQVHPEDKDRFIEKTNLDYLRRYFEKHDDDFTLIYRRKIEDGYENVLMEITKTDNFKDSDMEVFLYIKKIGE